MIRYIGTLGRGYAHDTQWYKSENSNSVSRILREISNVSIHTEFFESKAFVPFKMFSTFNMHIDYDDVIAQACGVTGNDIIQEYKPGTLNLSTDLHSLVGIQVHNSGNMVFLIRLPKYSRMYLRE